MPPRPEPGEAKRRLDMHGQFVEHWRGYGAADWMLRVMWEELRKTLPPPEVRKGGKQAVPDTLPRRDGR